MALPLGRRAVRHGVRAARGREGGGEGGGGRANAEAPPPRRRREDGPGAAARGVVRSSRRPDPGDRRCRVRLPRAPRVAEGEAGRREGPSRAQARPRRAKPAQGTPRARREARPTSRRLRRRRPRRRLRGRELVPRRGGRENITKRRPPRRARTGRRVAARLARAPRRRIGQLQVHRGAPGARGGRATTAVRRSLRRGARGSRRHGAGQIARVRRRQGPHSHPHALLRRRRAGHHRGRRRGGARSRRVPLERVAGGAPGRRARHPRVATGAPRRRQSRGRVRGGRPGGSGTQGVGDGGDVRRGLSPLPRRCVRVRGGERGEAGLAREASRRRARSREADGLGPGGFALLPVPRGGGRASPDVRGGVRAGVEAGGVRGERAVARAGAGAG